MAENLQKPKGMMVKEPQILQDFLIQTFKQNTKSSIKSWIHNRRIKVNNRIQTKYNFELRVGDIVELVKPTIQKQVRFDGLKILFEDEHLLVIDKEEGLLSIAGQNKEEITAFRILSNYVKEENTKNRIYVIHRLDKDTSGVMMYAKSEEIQEIMQRNWKQWVKERTYIALLEGELTQENGKIESYLKEGNSFIVHSSFKDNGGQFAVLEYKRLMTNSRNSLVEVSLETGKKNQIRVQFQSIGFPLVGDKKYGAKTNPIKRLGLHAKTLVFTHPINGKEMNFDVNPPKSFFQLLNGKL